MTSRGIEATGFDLSVTTTSVTARGGGVLEEKLSEVWPFD